MSKILTLKIDENIYDDVLNYLAKYDNKIKIIKKESKNKESDFKSFDLIKIDTKNFKFDREIANER